MCSHYGVSGKAYYFYKLHGRGRTCGLTPSVALERFKEGLRDDSMAFIYHCYNHYFCPIGYEEVAKKPEHAYWYVCDHVMLISIANHIALIWPLASMTHGY